ncbi:sensor histidine kinase RegB [Gemmobacter sp.]|uniref:sensor histidine kinase RegB n=1 Tax=Gemmobacter sp. TaxID=1898957 RepID=UPI002AFFFA02|nr:ActS/PrrB/RegB family redox-sensitive histidine kinase [Gemmobacter sp.]
MLPFATDLQVRTESSTWIRLRTLILLRWIAVAGQVAAILAASVWFGMALPLGPCAMAVGLSVIANLVSMTVLPASYRLTRGGALAMLLFDLAQLALLLALTGGLNNPFALLVVVPVTIAATGLTDRETAIIGAATLVCAGLFALFRLPLRLADGTELRMPPLLEFGHAIAIVIGVGFLAIYARRVSGEIRSMSEALMATQMALAREQKLTDLGGVVAAAAHELGTPLATIKLVSSELIEELADRDGLEDLREDAALIRDQADRCRVILQSMGRAGKDDLHLRHAPLDTVLREAAEPHSHRGKVLRFDLHPATGADTRQPQIRRAPEIIHGLRNLIQNAVDFATTTVWVEGQWSGDRLVVRIIDDGPGYPPNLLGRIGDPFLRPRADEGRDRPGYEGMGLGLFIAKTLLERSGATLSFANGGDPFLRQDERPARSGAIVVVSWPRALVVAPQDGPLGENRPIE